MPRFHARRTLIAAVVATALAGCGLPGPDASMRRWATTENTNVDIDWDAVNQAYRDAEGPEDLERRLNEIYEGDELISVAVHDQDAGHQVVTGFFDRNEDGQVGDDEKIFTITRNVVGEGSAQYQIDGYGHYAGYRSPMWDIASGMMLGSMLSGVFSPRYVPVYTQPYVTPTSRRAALAGHRTEYRAANPSRFGAKASGSGRSYGNRGGSFGGRPSAPRPSGGRFGVGARRRTRVVRLQG